VKDISDVYSSFNIHK